MAKQIIIVDNIPGGINTVCWELVHRAQATNVCHEYSFNGVRILARPTSDDKDLARMYCLEATLNSYIHKFGTI